MSSIGTLRALWKRLMRLLSPLRFQELTRVTDAAPRRALYDGFVLVSLSLSFPTFMLRSSGAHPSFTVDAGQMAPMAGLTTGDEDLTSWLFPIGTVVLFVVVMYLVFLFERRSWRKMREEMKRRRMEKKERRGGEPDKLSKLGERILTGVVTSIQQAQKIAHVLTSPYGIVSYRLNVPGKFRAKSHDRDESEEYKMLDAKILELLEADPNLDLGKYAASLGIVLVDFHRTGPPTAPAATPRRIFTRDGIVMSYELKDATKSYKEVEEQLREILDAHPDANLNALANDLGIVVRNIQRRRDDDPGSQPYDMQIGTK